ncbi:MAG TPA: hypothetical protein VGN07_10270 [Steroidobacteraceae bacterium]|jgi:hypothetical protein
MILRGRTACDKTGIPELHAQAFQEVANATGTVISSRAVGIYATDARRQWLMKHRHLSPGSGICTGIQPRVDEATGVWS